MAKYVEGEWEEALEIFRETHVKINYFNFQTMIPGLKDGPSLTLMNVILKAEGKSPADWTGVRQLTSK